MRQSGKNQQGSYTTSLWRENTWTRPADAANWRWYRDTEGNKYKLIRGVMQHRCGNTIREQVHTQSWGGADRNLKQRQCWMIKAKQKAQDMDHERKNNLQQASATIFKPNPAFFQCRTFRNAAAVTSDAASVSNSNYCLLNHLRAQFLKQRMPFPTTWPLDETNKLLVEWCQLEVRTLQPNQQLPVYPELCRMSWWFLYSDRLSDIGCGGRLKAAVCWWFPCLTSYPRASPAELCRHKSETDKSLFSGHCWTLYWSRKHFPVKAKQMLSCFRKRLNAGETSLYDVFFCQWAVSKVSTSNPALVGTIWTLKSNEDFFFPSPQPPPTHQTAPWYTHLTPTLPP